MEIVDLRSKLARKVRLLPQNTAHRLTFLVGVENAIATGNITGADLVTDVVAIAKVAETAMGGTSGALYSYAIFCLVPRPIHA
jgi:hypothetical protein